MTTTQLIEQLKIKLHTYMELSDYDNQSTGLVDLLHEIRQINRHILSLFPKNDLALDQAKQLMRQSNVLRDIDVLMTETLPEHFQLPKKALSQMQECIREERDKQNQKFIYFLNEEFSGFSIEEMGTPINQASTQTELKELEKKVNKTIKLLTQYDLESKQAHKLRLKLKRYAHQLNDYYPDERKLLNKIYQLQNGLGQFRDLAQSAQLLKKLLANSDIDINEGIATLETMADKKLREVQQQARRLLTQKA